MWWKMILFVILGLVVIISVALAYGSRRWQAETKALHANLEAARRPIEPKTYELKELEGLPAPVQRFFRAVLTPGQPMVAAVSLEHSGTFNMSETAEQWKPFTSTQHVIIQRPGFDWEGRIAMAPGLAVQVHDAYIAGEGILHATLFGLVSLAKMSGTPEIAQGELMRFFAEAAWYPTALLPSQGVRWEAVIPTPWQGRWSDYEFRDGMLIPLAGEVAWMLGEGPKPYWRGRITNVVYEWAQ
jgi:hypothetical protein